MSCHARSRLAVALLLLLLAGTRLAAIYLIPQVETVPVERLIRNLEAMAAKEPKDAAIRFNLARVHAMMFAKKMAADDPVEVLKGKETLGPWYGLGMWEPSSFKVVEAKTATRLKEAKEHLDVAIDLYRQGIALDPKAHRAKLGYAWCIDQSGDRAKAITAYRQVIAEEWPEAQIPAGPVERTPGNFFGDSEVPGGWGTYLTAEAAGYLIPLLDPQKDRDEIATLKDRIRISSAVFRGETPIAIPLSDSARPDTFLDAEARVSFDADGRAIPKQWTWITPDAAWLVHAPNKTRPVTSALQLFGSVTFWLFWENGYHALAALDDNGDGALKGAELDDLALWRDANRDGISEAGEVKALAEWNIVGLNCAHEDTRGRRDYVAFSPRGVTFKNGHTRPTWDVLLYPQPSRETTTE